MLIVCPSCASEYTIDPTKLGAGRTVRCAICRDTWYVQNPESATGLAGPEADTTGIEPQQAEGAGRQVSPARPRRRKGGRKRSSTHGPGWRRPAWVGAALLSAALLGAAVVRAEPLQRPAEALAVALGLGPPGHGLAFRNLTSELVENGRERVLVVDGEIVSLFDHELRLPMLEFSVRDAGQQVVATWADGPPRSTLAAGQAVRFSARLMSPPPEGRQVHVRFTTGEIGPAAHEAP
jgi:predicted Zn finger-like uncharacterized protein